MGRRDIEGRFVRVEYACDKCGEGTMKPTGMVIDTFPELFMHECSVCGSTASFETRYPCTEFRVGKIDILDAIREHNASVVSSELPKRSGCEK